MLCDQICPFNTLTGCNVKEKDGVCPLSNKYSNDYSLMSNMPEQLVKTNDTLVRKGKKYEVVIADDNIFVVCQLKFSKKEKSVIVEYSRPEIYANQLTINTLDELGFTRC